MRKEPRIMKLTGPRGKMGRLITQAAAEHSDIELIAGVGPSGRDYIGKDLGDVAMTGRQLGVSVVDNLESVIDSCDVIIDFSTKERCPPQKGTCVRHYRIFTGGNGKIQGSRVFHPHALRSQHFQISKHYE